MLISNVEGLACPDQEAVNEVLRLVVCLGEIQHGQKHASAGA